MTKQRGSPKRRFLLKNNHGDNSKEKGKLYIDIAEKYLKSMAKIMRMSESKMLLIYFMNFIKTEMILVIQSVS